MPEAAKPFLESQLKWAKALHESDLKRGLGCVELPYAIERKYNNAGKDWVWQMGLMSATFKRF